MSAYFHQKYSIFESWADDLYFRIAILNVMGSLILDLPCLSKKYFLPKIDFESKINGFIICMKVSIIALLEED